MRVLALFLLITITSIVIIRLPFDLPFAIRGGIAIGLSSLVVLSLAKKLKQKFFASVEFLHVYAATLTALFWFLLIPVTVERSLSVYFLEEVDARGSVTAEDTNEILKMYVLSDLGTEKRLFEQTSIGTLVEANGDYSLSVAAHVLIRAFGTVRAIYGI